MRIRLTTLVLLVSPVLLLIAAAYVQWGLFGLPSLPPETTYHSGPVGFPAWLRIGHYINFLFIVLLIRSGLQILMDHPRLYWNVHCTPDSEWLRLTPVKVPLDRIWTAKDDARHLSPWIGLPGGPHTVGMARHWHFASVLFWIVNGLVFVGLLFGTQQWQRLAPTSWSIVPDAWSVFVHYATFHLPPEPDGFYRYNALQQLTYFSVVFVLAPLTIAAGLTMSPALTNRFKWYPRLFGNRQVGRSIHFLINVRLSGFHRHARRDGGHHRLCQEHESHCRGHRRWPPDRAGLGSRGHRRRHRRQRVGQLVRLEAAARRAARR